MVKLPSDKAAVLAALVLTCALPVARTAGAPIASSTFSSGDESWRLVSTIGYNGPVAWSSTGGNPGGFIYGQDPDTGAFGFAAPAKFLGNVSAAYNQPLSFDVAAYQQPDTTQSWVGISGAGNSFICYYNTPATPYPSWYSRSVTLREDAGWIDPNTSQPPTHAQMLATLASLDGLVIAAEFVQGLSNDISGLDNVVLAPEPATLLALTIGGLVLCFPAHRRR